MATRTIDALIAKLADLPRDDRLVVMAQNPANNHHWSRSVAPPVKAGELLSALRFARDTIRAMTEWSEAAAQSEREAGR